jgi:acyl-CoA thioesterase
METLTVRDFFKNDAFAAAAGVELLDVKNGYARARMEVTPAHLNGGGVCQGGAIFTLADLAFAVATNSHARLTFSISSVIHIFKSEKSGFLYAEAHEVFNHNRLSNCEVKVTNEQGELIATFTGTGYRKDIPLPFEPM